MTTPKKPLPPTASDADERDIRTPWYRAPIVWLGILLTAGLIAGYSVLIYISHEQASHTRAGASIKESAELNQLFGVPFDRDQLQAAKPQPAPADKP